MQKPTSSYSCASTLNSCHTDSINVLTFSPCGKYLASGADDGVVYIYNPRQGAKFMKVVAHHAVTTLAWHPTGNGRLFVGREDGQVVFLDIHDSGLSGSYKLPIASDKSESEPAVRALTLDYSGTHLAVAKGRAVVLLQSNGCHDQRVPFVERQIILSPPAVEGLLDEIPLPHSVQFLTYDGDVLLLVSYLCHGIICVGPAQAREAVRWHLVPPSYRMGRPTVSPDQTLLVVFNCLDGFDIYSMGSKVEMPQLRNTFRLQVSKNILLPAIFINNGKSILLGSANGSVCVASITNTASRRELPHGRGDIIQALAYHQIGSVHYVATGTSEKGVDTYIKIWKAGLPSHEVRLRRLQLDPLCKYISTTVVIALIATLFVCADDLKPYIVICVDAYCSMVLNL
ncbi:WD40 repeat-like protein [Pleurotus eryngii]|uniref:WD40 repeat-like protein n=1 Tax=Pleurotus eryngii TaxID=5323 RepID=A0A9P6A549_PLEER|nr:WD40 repeat-like protein [Pleurotus eryngii]